jgi:hypothetical protein
MSQHDNVLKMYAESGLRTVEDWATLGREMAAATKKPRLVTAHRGASVSLYSRDQTQPRTRTREARA